MRLTTRSRYAVRALIDLSLHEEKGFVSLQAISERQEISLHYLEQIFHRLKKSGVVKSKKGLGGGYILGKKPEEITIGEIMRAVEGPIAPVFCLDPDSAKDKCHRANNCTARILWMHLESRIEEFLDGVTLKQLKEDAVFKPCD